MLNKKNKIIEDKDQNLKKKKRALINEIISMVNSKNTFEDTFYNELTKVQ